MSRVSVDPMWVRTALARLAALRSIAVALGVMLAALTSPGHAQTPDLGTAADFAVLGGSTVTNTGPRASGN